ncbi:hypothetical protein GCM10010411_30260 [Actinomadura fulvescens]|uniref:Uncharacterized protein n=1 Tax=Actinomadura fulvescens TaxID=46160 RepID=A0ABN3PNE9_9ACTN
MPTTTATVMTGWAIHNHRQRPRVLTMSPVATTNAQPMCSDGIAAYWLATVSACGGPYTEGPKRAPVSTRPVPVSMRGGASGRNRWRASPAAVRVTSTHLIQR